MPRFSSLSQVFLRVGSGLLLAVAVSECTSPTARLAPAVDFNQDWQFVKDIDTAVTAQFFTETTDTAAQWVAVSLPHTAQLEPVVTDKKQWQGTCFYRKFFQVPCKRPCIPPTCI
jgi:beta-galactosidase